MTSKKAIVIKQLVKHYGNTPALQGVDLKVEHGEIVGFLGPNGAGKTTTIRCMLDMIRPTSGQIEVLGHNPQIDTVKVRALSGYLPGELNLEGNLKAAAQIKYFAELRRNKIAWKYVETLAERLDLDLNRQIKNFSKGNKQKVGVIQAFMHHPQLLILDEPTSGLDPLVQQEVYSLIKEARDAGATVFFSSHVINEVETISDRVAIIRQGKIVEEAKPEDLVSKKVRQFKISFERVVNPAQFTSLNGVSLKSQLSDTVLTFQVEGEIKAFINTMSGFPIEDIEIHHTSLEEAFLTYYK